MIEINPGILVAQIITFLIGLVLIWKFFLKPLNKKLEERKNTIEKNYSLAEKTRIEVENFKKEYELKISDIQSKANQIINSALEEAELKKQDIIKLAKEQAKELLEKTHQQLQEEKKIIIKQLHNQIAQLGLLIAEKIMEKTVDKNIQEKLLEEIIKQLSDEKL